MRGRTLPLITLILGLATLAAFLALGGQPAVRSVYPASEVSTHVSAFQRAETPADIFAVFGFPPDAAKIAAMDALNTVDLWAFVPAYALFLTAAAILLGGLANRWTQAAIVFALIGAGADAMETWKQLQLTADLDNVDAHLPIAPWHWLKYAALGLNGVAIASLCFTAPNKRWILGVIALATFPIVALSYMSLITPRAFAGTLAVYWIALLVIAGVETFRPAARVTGSQP